MKSKARHTKSKTNDQHVRRGTESGEQNRPVDQGGEDLEPDARPAAETGQSDAPAVELGREDGTLDPKGLQSRIAELEDQLLRAKAEQQNIRKRCSNELAEAVRYANAPLIKALLGTVDDFDRTLVQSGTADAETVLRGVQLIYDNFMKVLQDNSVEVVQALDKPFDPVYHEAVQQLPAEGKEPGTVIQVLQQGVKLNGRVLRPAKVIVAAAVESDDQSDSEGQAGAEAAGTTKEEG